MRVHKYRAWDRLHKDMSRPFELGEDVIFDCKDHAEHKVNCQSLRYSEYDGAPQFIVMQYIAMNGENGEDIIQDDIAEVTMLDYYSNETISLEENDTFIGEVVMHNFMWMVRAKDATNIPLIDVTTGDMLIKILGNPYENPELLEKSA